MQGRSAPGSTTGRSTCIGTTASDGICSRRTIPNAAWISDRTISIPLSPKLTDSDVDDVIDSVRRVLGHFSD